MSELKPLGFTFFISYYEAMRALTMENKGRMLTAMTDFVFKGRLPTKSFFEVKDKGQSSVMAAVWSAIRPNLQTSRNRSHVGKSGAPIGNKNASKQNICESHGQSKNNQLSLEDKKRDKEEKTIEEYMVVGSNNSSNNNLSFSLISDVKSLWANVKSNQEGLKEAQWLQDEVSRYRTANPDALSEQEYIKFMVYWATPIDKGEYSGHCRYVEIREKTNTFCVSSRLASWKSKINEK